MNLEQRKAFYAGKWDRNAVYGAHNRPRLLICYDKTTHELEKQLNIQAKRTAKKVSDTKYEVEDGSVIERLEGSTECWTLSKDGIHQDTDAFVNDLAERRGIKIEY